MDYNKFDSVFEISPSLQKINYTLAVLTPRKIDNGSAIKYKGKYYQPYLDNEIKCFLPKTPALVIKAFDGTLLITVDDSIYELRELIRNKSTSEEIDGEEEAKDKVKGKYIPPMTQPWKIEAFQKQMKKAHTEHVYT